MSRLAPPTTINGPEVAVPVHTLLSSAQTPTDVDDRWEQGFCWLPEACVEAIAWDPDCPPGATEDDPRGLPGSAATKDEGSPVVAQCNDPFILYSPFTCNPVGFEWLDFDGRARRQLETATPKGLEAEFWDGVLKPDNYRLTGVPVVDASAGGSGILPNGGTPEAPTAFDSPKQALAALTQAIANCGPGGRGMIHATPQLVTIWHANALLTEEQNRRLVTSVKRNIVVPGAGYSGNGPTDDPGTPNPPPAGMTWAYATGMVAVHVGDIRTVPDEIGEGLNRRTNLLTYRAERTVGYAVDDCCIVAALVSLV